MKRLLFYLILGCVLISANIAAQAQLTFQCHDVTVPIAGALETDAYAINNAGTIAGDYVDSSGVQHGLLQNKKQFTTFDGPSGSAAIAAYGINDSNAAVGWYVDSNGVPQGFLYANGQLSSVFFPHSSGTEANGINDNGWIVGTYIDKFGVFHGFYWDTVKYHKVDVPGAAYTSVWSINNAGLMAVYTLTSGGAPLDGYIYDRKTKTFTNVDVPGAAGSVIHGINDNGDINYTIFDSSSNRHGVLFHAGVFTQFDDPKGKNATRADGINDTLAMVGRYSPPSGANLGFKCSAK